MHVWVLEIFDRCDGYCQYDSKVVAVYSKSKFREARKHFKKLCDGRIEDGFEINRWKNEKGYHFNCHNGSCTNHIFNYVGLIKMEVF